MRRTRTPAELGFDRYDPTRLARAMDRATEARVFRRLQAVLLIALGWTVIQVARITRLRPWAVYFWMRRYLKAHQPEALADAPRSGRPLAARAITDARILRELRRDPLRLGYNTTGWTVALLARHLSEKYACAISAATLRRRMRRLRLRWKRPRYAYATKDPHRAQKKGL